MLPANGHLKEGGGTSRTIFEAAGRRTLTKACDTIGYCDIGSAVPTLAYKLNAKYIIYAVMPRWSGGQCGEYDMLSAAYLSALSTADLMGCKSIAFPLLASGKNGFDRELALSIAEESIGRFSGTRLKRITLVVLGDDMEVFMKTMGYAVRTIPERLRTDEKKAEQKAKAEKLLAEGKEVAQKTLEEQAVKAIEWLKDKNNREKIVRCGIEIVQMVFAMKK